MRKLLLLAFLCSFFVTEAFSATYTTAAAGNWMSSSTWVGGNIPDPEDLNGNTIVIGHDVTIQNKNLKLNNGATVTITGVDFTANGGNIIVETGVFTFSGGTLTVASGWSIQQTTSNGHVYISNATVNVGQNFQNAGGIRVLNGICLDVAENYQNDGGTDTLINVCMIGGSGSSGSFQNNSNGTMYIMGSRFNVLNGNFQNQSGSTITGQIDAIWVQNGNLQNSGTWTATVTDYCVSQQVTVSSQYLPASQSCGTINSNYFSGGCACLGSSNPPLALTVSATDAECNGEASGSVDLTVSGGNPGYTYSWSNGATTEDLTNVAAGTYTVTVTDQSGSTASISATVNEPTALMASTSSTDVGCNGGNDGSATVNASGGTPPYSYAWSDGQTTQTATGLAAGTYSVVVTDANGCTTAAYATVDEPDALTVSTVSSDVSCNGGSDGSASAIPAGGTAPYSYSWSNGFNSYYNQGLAAGNYTVTITDANGCTASASVTINEPTAVTVTANATDETCPNQNDGTASASASGGTPAYTYSWSNGATGANVSGLAPGSYTVTATDANGCTGSASVSVAAASNDSCVIEPGDYRTQTQGGWGSGCKGNNPGCYRDANFATAFPNGLTIGCQAGFTLTLTSSAAVEAYLPCGGPAGVLTQNYTDPGCIGNVFSSQLIAASLSVGFDDADPNFGGSTDALEDLVLATGPLAGVSVGDVIAEANNAIGGCGSIYSIGDLNSALTTINENFVDGTINKGDLTCDNPCAQAPQANVVVTETDATAWPNPSVEVVNVQYYVEYAGEANVEIYGVDGGKVVRNQNLGGVETGDHIYTWDGSDNRGQQVKSGMYLIRIRIGETQTSTAKVIRN